MTLDRKKLAVVHILKKELNLSDQEYRDELEKVTGVRSAKDLDERSFARLMRYFVRSKYYRLNKEGLTIKQKMYIKYFADELGWDLPHLNNFIRKYYHKNNLDDCSKKEASKLIEALKSILKRQT